MFRPAAQRLCRGARLSTGTGELATAQQTAQAPPLPPRTVRKSTLRSRLTSFFVGFACAAGGGYYQLYHDVEATGEKLDFRITALVEATSRLRDRVEALEKERE